TTKGQKARAYYWLAETAAKTGNTSMAQRYYTTIYERYPENEWAPKALYARGRLYLRAKQFDQASETFEILKHNYPNKKITRQAGTALGEAYYKMENYEKALETLQKSLFYVEGNQKKKAVLLIGESYNALGQLD